MGIPALVANKIRSMRLLDFKLGIRNGRAADVDHFMRATSKRDPEVLLAV